MNKYFSLTALIAFVLAVGLPLCVSLAVLCMPDLVLAWRRLFPVKPDKMPAGNWYKVKKIFRKEGGRILLHLREENFYGHELFCLLRTNDSNEKSYEHLFSKQYKDLCISFLPEKKDSKNKECIIDYDLGGSMVNTSHLSWCLEHKGRIRRNH